MNNNTVNAKELAYTIYEKICWQWEGIPVVDNWGDEGDVELTVKEVTRFLEDIEKGIKEYFE